MADDGGWNRATALTFVLFGLAAIAVAVGLVMLSGRSPATTASSRPASNASAPAIRTLQADPT